MKKDTKELKALREKMSYQFELSFGHNLSDEEHQRHFDEYMKIRREYCRVAGISEEG